MLEPDTATAQQLCHALLLVQNGHLSLSPHFCWYKKKKKLLLPLFRGNFVFSYSLSFQVLPISSFVPGKLGAAADAKYCKNGKRPIGILHDPTHQL